METILSPAFADGVARVATLLILVFFGLRLFLNSRARDRLVRLWADPLSKINWGPIQRFIRYVHANPHHD
jgi:hypothetical protein